ncbi:MAG TPA: LiaF-related protein [Bacteroidales bacterium]|nr:LiaF-related protein [Bacteroidales bacterium]
MKTHHSHHKSGIGFAGLLILIGALLLSVRLHIFPQTYASVIISWQMLLIVLGIYNILKKHYITSVVLIGVGLFFIVPLIASVPNSFITDLPQNYFGTFWPVLLIFAGILIVIKRTCYANESLHTHCKFHNHAQKSTWENTNGYVYKNSSFQTSEHIVLDPEFKGGDLQISFGETTLDLRKTTLSNEQVILNIKISFGSIIIYVPYNWNIQPQVDAAFGGFEDKRYGAEASTDNKSLIIRGNVTFGNAELRN